RERCLTILHICTVVKKKLRRGEGRPRSTHHIRSGSWCPTKSASLLASAGSGTQRRCCVQAVGFRGALPETPGQKSRLFYLSAQLFLSASASPGTTRRLLFFHAPLSFRPLEGPRWSPKQGLCQGLSCT